MVTHWEGLLKSTWVIMPPDSEHKGSLLLRALLSVWGRGEGRGSIPRNRGTLWQGCFLPAPSLQHNIHSELRVTLETVLFYDIIVLLVKSLSIFVNKCFLLKAFSPVFLSFHLSSIYQPTHLSTELLSITLIYYLYTYLPIIYVFTSLYQSTNQSIISIKLLSLIT